MGKLLLLLCVVGGCATSDADTKSDATVSLSAVNLADDCPAPPVTAPANRKPPPPTQGSSTNPGPAAIAPPSDCGGPGCGRRCDQTSMQLAIKAPVATAFKIKKVELLDDKGKLLDTLTAREPKRWDAATSKYVAWDEKATGDTKVMYDLSLNWGKLGGRWSAQNKKYQLRVTITVGNSTKTIDKQSIAPVTVPPPIPT